MIKADPVLRAPPLDFDSVAAASEGPVVLWLSAKWCGPCTAMVPIVREVATAHPDLPFAKIDVDDDGFDELVKRHPKLKVNAVPTFAVFINWECVRVKVGAMSKAALEKFVMSTLDAKPEPKGGA